MLTMSETADTPQPQRPRLTNEQILAAASGEPRNPFTIALWVTGVLAAVAALVLYIVGLVPPSSDFSTSTSDLLAESAAKANALTAAGNVLIVAAIFIAAALVLGARRWVAKA